MTRTKRTIAAVAVAVTAVLIPVVGSFTAPSTAMACAWGAPGPGPCWWW